MAETSNDDGGEPVPQATTGVAIPLRARLPALWPLAAIWAIALLPVLLWLVSQQAPQTAVAIANTARQIAMQTLLVVVVAAVVGLMVYPPLPAWLRRFKDRLRTSWSADRGPITRALSELQHFETAQKHFEVAKLAWIRSDYPLVGKHVGRSVELDATMPHAQHLLGLFSLRIGALPTALAAFTAAEQLDQGHAFGDAQLHLARAQHLTGQLEASLQTYADYERNHGGSHRSHYWHGEALLAAGQAEAAALAFQAAAADPKMRLTSEENWFRARARVRCWRLPQRLPQGDSK